MRTSSRVEGLMVGVVGISCSAAQFGKVCEGRGEGVDMMVAGSKGAKIWLAGCHVKKPIKQASQSCTHCNQHMNVMDAVTHAENM